MKPITINQLKKMCEQQIKKGNGNKFIMISSDDEGNSYHYLWYDFQEASKIIEEMNEFNLKNNFKNITFYIDGFDDKIAKIEDTIILG